tara:strand:- start:610 stop:1065 length:456 start_codon:yes stop_codon:yes gene_type:complete
MKELTLEFLGKDQGDLIQCEFDSSDLSEIKESKKIFLEIEDFINKNVFLKNNAKCFLRENKGGYKLIITGKGWDGRCRWCRFFRNHLKKELSQHNVVLKEKGFCNFDQKEERGVSEKQKLINRKKRMEMGVIEATQEDYDRLCKSIDDIGE